MTSTINEIELKKWFPGLYRKGTGTKCQEKPKLRIICFPPAGCAEDLFSTEGTGARHDKSPILQWAHAHSTEVLSIQYPGRANRKKEMYATSIQDIVKPLHSILCEYCNDDVPYVIIAHSVGTWIAYELLQLAEGGSTTTATAKMMKMPEQVFFSSFPPPTIPMKERPWNINKELSEEEFKTECRRWNINEIVFTHVWSIYHPMLRADFTLFDQYKHDHQEEQSNFTWPLTVFYARHDDMITSTMCKGWQEQTSGTFEFIPISGHHLFPLDKEQKSIWLNDIVKRMDGIMEMIELKLEYAGMGL